MQQDVFTRHTNWKLRKKYVGKINDKCLRVEAAYEEFWLFPNIWLGKAFQFLIQVVMYKSAESLFRFQGDVFVFL